MIHGQQPPVLMMSQGQLRLEAGEYSSPPSGIVAAILRQLAKLCTIFLLKK